MIPKVIHYCWFGGNKLPDDAIKCIESWKKYCPDYEIKEWNESNFDLNSCTYVKQAYEEKKWAFVSDYARFWILNNYGGLYFDTDVEIIKPLDDLLKLPAFMGVEKGGTFVAPGLAMGFEKGNPICEAIKKDYDKAVFILENGEYNPKIVVNFATEVVERYGYNHNESGIQELGDITIFPYEYFCPIDYHSGVLELTPNTYSIHWYNASWISDEKRKFLEIEQWVSKRFGKKMGYIAERVYSLPYRVKSKVGKVGIKKALLLAFEKIFRINRKGDQ